MKPEPLPPDWALPMDTAPDFIALITCEAVAEVSDCHSSAATPAACGVAAEVPKKLGYEKLIWQEATCEV
jgi:hypothetical protein